MPKNIVIFSDGTSQEGGKKNNTNVYKLFNIVEDRTSKQIVFYDRGIGVIAGVGVLIGVILGIGIGIALEIKILIATILGIGIGTILGGVIAAMSGLGISRNIKECYQFIFENFESKDKIFLFGFSRGAATVRSLSGFIHLFGILPKSRPELIKKAYKIYKIKDDDKRKTKAEEFIAKHHTMGADIEFIGVWDTVSALGFPLKPISLIIDQIPFFRHKFHDFKLSPNVKNAFQALAIDEERKTFKPIIWDKEKRPNQKIKQVWFSGSHTDVGGGYEENDLSDITLEWMKKNALACKLLPYKKDWDALTLKPNANGVMHDSRGGFFSKLYRKQERSWNKKESGELYIHESVFSRKKNKTNKTTPKYSPWILKMKHKKIKQPAIKK